MKIALLLSGPYRGNSDMVKIHNENIGKYDTYVSTLPKYKKEWEDSDWDITKIYTTNEVKFSQTNWYKFRNDGAGQAGFCQFWNLTNVINNVPSDYDWYIKSRNDLVFNDRLNINFEFLNKDTFYCPNKYFDGQMWNTETLNDQFYIVSYDTLKVIGEFVNSFYQQFSHPLNYKMSSNERCLRTWLNENNIKVEGFDYSYSKNHNGNDVPSGYYKFQLEQ